MDSVGAVIQSYTFFEEGDAGFFVNAAFQLPQEVRASFKGIDLPSEFYDSANTINLTAGPAYRYSLSEGISLRGGVGLAATLINVAMDKKKSPAKMHSIDLGHAVDARLYVQLYRQFYLSAGTGIALDLVNYTYFSGIDESISDWGSDYAKLELKPYIAFGYLIG